MLSSVFASLKMSLLIRFPSSCLVESGFSVIVELLRAKGNRLEISKRGHLRLKLTKLEPRIKQTCDQHQTPNSHSQYY